MDEPLDFPTRVLKHRNLVDNDDDDSIAAGKHGVVTSIKSVSDAQDLSVAHVSLLKDIVWVAHFTTTTMVHEKEDHVIAKPAYVLVVVASQNDYVNINDDNFNKMVPVAQAIMVTMLRQTKKV